MKSNKQLELHFIKYDFLCLFFFCIFYTHTWRTTRTFAAAHTDNGWASIAICPLLLYYFVFFLNIYFVHLIWPFCCCLLLLLPCSLPLNKRNSYLVGTSTSLNTCYIYCIQSSYRTIGIYIFIFVCYPRVDLPRILSHCFVHSHTSSSSERSNIEKLSAFSWCRCRSFFFC